MPLWPISICTRSFRVARGAPAVANVNGPGPQGAHAAAVRRLGAGPLRLLEKSSLAVGAKRLARARQRHARIGGALADRWSRRNEALTAQAVGEAVSLPQPLHLLDQRRWSADE